MEIIACFGCKSKLLVPDEDGTLIWVEEDSAAVCELLFRCDIIESYCPTCSSIVIAELERMANS